MTEADTPFEVFDGSIGPFLSRCTLDGFDGDNNGRRIYFCFGPRQPEQETPVKEEVPKFDVITQSLIEDV